MAISQKPKIRYQVSVRRSQFFRRFAWSILGAVGAAGAWVALEEAAARRLVDLTVLQIGAGASIVVLVLFVLRALISLIRGFTRRTETLRLFDKGFVWTVPNDEHKYGWSQLEAFREGGHGIYLGKRPIVQWGALRLKMQDGKVFKITGMYGDLRVIAAIIRRYATHFTGIQMARLLREEQPVRLHRRLTMWPGGIEAGKQEIPWSEGEVRLKGSTLTVFEKKKGKFRVVKRYNAGSVDNVGGFMDVAKATIRNNQRERFEKRTTETELIPGTKSAARSFNKGN